MTDGTRCAFHYPDGRRCRKRRMALYGGEWEPGQPPAGLSDFCSRHYSSTLRQLDSRTEAELAELTDSILTKLRLGKERTE